MTDTELTILLGLLKIALHRADTAVDELLKAMLHGAYGMIVRKGVTLDLQEIYHQMLVVGHAEWQYRAREQDVPMPPWLRQGIHDLLLSQKAVQE